jgi:hypothetical protein
MPRPLAVGSVFCAVRCTCALFAFALGTFTLPAEAAAGTTSIHKCGVEGGAVTYQDEPCKPGRELRDFDKDPAEVSVVPFAPAPQSVQAVPKRTKESAAATREPPARKQNDRAAKRESHRGDAAQRKFLAPGIAIGQVLARIGTPDMKSGGGKGRKSERWTYLPAADDPQTVTTLTFEAGRLIEVERKIVR